MPIPSTPRGIYADIKRRYIPELPPSEGVSFSFIEHLGEGTWIDTRDEEACVVKDGNLWKIEIDVTLRDFPKWLYLVLVHECLHIILPSAKHGDKEWNKAVRQLNGKGLLGRIF